MQGKDTLDEWRNLDQFNLLEQLIVQAWPKVVPPEKRNKQMVVVSQRECTEERSCTVLWTILLFYAAVLRCVVLRCSGLRSV